MHERRYKAIQTAKRAKKWGVILGTLGRQGSTHILDRIENCLKRHNCEFLPILLSEIFPSKLSILSSQCDAWVQIACPRLSVDWASGFTQPLLSPYEFFVCFSEKDNDEQPGIKNAQTEWLPNGVYPMDYYSSNGGEWTNYYHRKFGQADVIGAAVENESTKKISGRDALALIRAKRAAKKESIQQTTTTTTKVTELIVGIDQVQLVNNADGLD